MNRYFQVGIIALALLSVEAVAKPNPDVKTYKAVVQAKATFEISSDVNPDTKEFDAAFLDVAIKMKDRNRLLDYLCNRADQLKLTLRIYYGGRHLNLSWSGIDEEIMRSLEVEIAFDKDLKPLRVTSAITTQGRVNPQGYDPER